MTAGQRGGSINGQYNANIKTVINRDRANCRVPSRHKSAAITGLQQSNDSPLPSPRRKSFDDLGVFDEIQVHAQCILRIAVCRSTKQIHYTLPIMVYCHVFGFVYSACFLWTCGKCNQIVVNFNHSIRNKNLEVKSKHYSTDSFANVSDLHCKDICAFFKDFFSIFVVHNFIDLYA